MYPGSRARGKKLYFIYERRVGRDRPVAACAVGQVCGDNKKALASHLHTEEPLVEAGEHLPAAEHKLYRATADRSFKHGAVLEFAGVVNRKHVAELSLAAGTNKFVLRYKVCNSGGRCRQAVEERRVRKYKKEYKNSQRHEHCDACF